MKVFYIDIDTLRPDHLGCNGYQKITPNIDALAADGHNWSNAFSANTPCMPARASVFTCQFGAKNGIETHGRPSLWIQSNYETMLPNVLAHQNVYTATVSSFGGHPAPWFFTGFCTVVDPALCCNSHHFQHIDGRDVNNQAFKLIEHIDSEDLFLHLHYWEPHSPLVAPETFVNRIDYTPNLAHIDDKHLNKLILSTTYRGGQQMGILSRNDLQDIVKQYDAEILYVDYLIGELISYLKSNNLYDDAMIILSSDHGEQYGEGGLVVEHGSVNDSCIRVPLIIKMPDAVGAGSVHTQFVYSMDIGPTIVEALGKCPSSDWQSKSLLSMIEGRPGEERNYVVCDHGLYTCQRAVRTSEWKMVHTYHPGIWDFPEYALFNLKNDPCEYLNIADENPSILAELKLREQEWLTRNSPSDFDALQVIANTTGPDGFANTMSR